MHALDRQGLVYPRIRLDWSVLPGQGGVPQEAEAGKSGPSRQVDAGRSRDGLFYRGGLFPIVFLPGSTTSSLVKAFLLIAFFPLMVFGLYRGRRKKEEETRKEEERLREPLVLRNQVVRSARKAFIGT